MIGANERNIQFRASDGTRFQLRLESFADYFLNRKFLSFASLCVVVSGMVVLLFMSAMPFSIGLAIYSAFLILIILAVVVFWLVAVGAVLNALERRRYIKVVFTPIFYLAFIPLPAALYYFGAPDPDFGFIGWVSGIFFVIFACIDIMHAKFVAPLHPNYVHDTQPQQMYAYQDEGEAAALDRPAVQSLAQQRTIATSPAPQTPTMAAPMPVASVPDVSVPDGSDAVPDTKGGPDQTVVIAKQKFQVSDIRQIQSEDHYLQITVSLGKKLVRGKLSEVVKQIPPHYGMQINRSTWISHQEIASLSDAEQGRLVLTLKDGEQVIVPKMRELLLRQQYAAYLADRADA